MQKTLKSRYDNLVPKRNSVLTRARAASKLTIPSLIPEEGHNENSVFEAPWQSIGSRGVNNLSSKMVLALFPPNAPFFRLRMDEATQQRANLQKGVIEEALAAYERVVVDDIEHSKTRAALAETCKHLIAGGNALLYDDPNTGHVRMYPLARYVVRRDAAGNVYEIIATDATVFAALPLEVKQALVASKGAQQDDTDLTIYTGIFRDPIRKVWDVRQEVEDVVIPGSSGTYPLDACPWIPLRFVAIDGENYGRSYVEDLYGDLNTLDALTQAVTESASIAALVKFLVDPNGSTDIDDLVDTPNGGLCAGREQDVSVLRVDKSGDLRVAMEAMMAINSRLDLAFLMHSSVQRDAERVTAEEIRYMAAELEDALGGIYSVLSQELQLPLVQHRISRLTKQKKLVKLPEGITPEIITGLEALGRGHELQRLRMFVADASQTFGPEIVAEYVEVSEHLRRSAAALNLNTTGYVRDEQTVQANRERRMQAEAAARAQQQQGGQ